MCGIIGYIGPRDPLPILIDGLKKLEYRGYDSAGLCVKNGGALHVVKKRGAISDLESELRGRDMPGHVGIAHTRWATHGEPNETNAHPHLNGDGAIAVVHNGIIENYYALREWLTREGCVFRSQTDSEVLPHLIGHFYEGDLERALLHALQFVEGAFGVVAVHKDENRIVAARRGSPLILGVGEDEMFAASDVPAVLDNTRKVVYLHDNEVAVITAGRYAITNLEGAPIDKQIHEIQWTVDQIEKKGFKHFMLKEIAEQPESLRNTLRGRIKAGRIKLNLDVDPLAIERVIITACGTSWHAGLIGKQFIESLTRIPVEVDYASEFRYRDPIVRPTDLVVAISQSGETADTLASVREAQSKNAKVIGVVNVVGSTISREVASGIYLHCGPEIGVASTKAFTSQVAAMLLLALFLRQERGLALDAGLLESLAALPALAEDYLGEARDAFEIAERFQFAHNFLYLGRGLNYPVALEGALKLKEISYIHAEGYPAAEMKHGPIALIDHDMPVIFIATRSQIFDKIVSNMQEVKARKGRVITVLDEDEPNVTALSDYVIHVPRVREELSPIVNALPLQQFAYAIADLKGLNPDKPRNLAKSVTVE
ncbi:MAG: glutamine--fructose-6-phosphate transaminase (isomerizing) [bacterium]|nr:glutamine--fructose-6-phosphate transaminase (isomerizing) [bacterium]